MYYIGYCYKDIESNGRQYPLNNHVISLFEDYFGKTRILNPLGSNKSAKGRLIKYFLKEDGIQILVETSVPITGFMCGLIRNSETQEIMEIDSVRICLHDQQLNGYEAKEC